MIAALKPYPAYKDSGVPWLGQVPEHWEVRRLKNICRFVYGDALADNNRKEGTTPVYGSNGPVGFHSAPNTKAPCIVIGRKGSFGKVQYSDLPVFAIDTTFFIDSRFTSANLRWLFYALVSLHLDEIPKDSAVPGLDREDAYKFNLPLPPLPEQSAIVRFLDYFDRRIRRVIRAKQKLIKLLEEYKQALIQQAVTGRIDVRTSKPYPAYKDSGVEWLGRVPEHWEIKRLRSLCNMRTGNKDTIDKVVDGQYPFFVRSQNVERINSYSYDGEAVLTAGDGVGVARVFHYINGKFDYHQRVYMFSNFRKVAGKYFYEYLRSTLKYEALFGNAKSTVDSLRQPMLKNFPFSLPPLPEQTAIVEYLDARTAKIDAAVDAARREIEILREFRERLIADVVTGKLDVREVAARLPEEAEAPEKEEPVLNVEEETALAEDEASNDGEKDNEEA